jgi:hypothetical protein
MISGIVFTIGIELCVLVAYLVVRGIKETKEEKQRIYWFDEDLYI